MTVQEVQLVNVCVGCRSMEIMFLSTCVQCVCMLWGGAWVMSSTFRLWLFTH